MVTALEQRVERRRAPDQIFASHSTNGAVDRTRPLCPYPQNSRLQEHQEYRGGELHVPEAANVISHPPVTGGIHMTEPVLPIVAIDTTRGSVLHRWAMGANRTSFVFRVYVGSVLLTYVPLALAALASPLPLLTQTSSLRLPFGHDWNTAFTFLVTFPALVLLTATDHIVLNSALWKVQREGVLVVSPRAADMLAVKWRDRFHRLNTVAYTAGVAAGLMVSWLNYFAYTSGDVGYWISRDGHLLPCGYVFLLCVFLFFGLIPVYVIRNVAISILLKDLVDHSELRLLPFHPDRCGGIRPVGELGLRSQYALTVMGLNVISLVVVSLIYLKVPLWLYGLIIAAGIGYAALGPVVFMGPLLPFRAGMLKTKAELMGEVAQRLRLELQRLRKELPAGELTKEDEELVERLRKLGSVIDELPVWPFDAGTLKRFVTAYVIPIVSALGYPVIQYLAGKLVSS
jgi:hypothetical protein